MNKASKITDKKRKTQDSKQAGHPEPFKFVTLFSCQDLSMAYVARSKLEFAGIPCILGNEYLIGVEWLYSTAVGGVEVKVPEEYLPMALELFTEDNAPQPDIQKSQAPASEQTVAAPSCPEDPDAPPPDDEAFLPDIVCPACGGMQIDTINLKRFAAVLSFLIELPLLFCFKHRYRCRSCGHRWKQ